MSFVSIDWLAWMWLTVSLYWLTPPQFRTHVLMVLSLIFLGSISLVSAVILVAFCLLCHVAMNVLRPTALNVTAASLTMVAVLIWFKLQQATQSDFYLENIIIPLGLSYYTFRCVHFVVERFKGQLSATTLMDVAGYLFFIPTFVIGPIHRYKEFAIDSRRQRFDPAMLSGGLERILFGYAKIVILSNFASEFLLGKLAVAAAGTSGLLAGYLGVVKTGLNVYLQFSGHSDIAIGFAALLGYRIMENFNWPYLQPNIQAFWQNWHRSLSLWCREYIYGVVVALTRSPALGALSTMVVIGLWHEISVRFLLWGAYHGLGIVAWRQFRALRERLGIEFAGRLQRPAHVASVLLTVHFVWFGFYLLNAPIMDQATRAVSSFFSGGES